MVQAYWAAATRGMLPRPGATRTASTPEQSNEFGPVAPQTYGLPSSAKAHSSATVVVDNGAGMRALGCELQGGGREQLGARL